MQPALAGCSGPGTGCLQQLSCLSLHGWPCAQHIKSLALPWQVYCPNAVLAVHRDRVRLRPCSFYATLLQQTTAGPNLEASHYMERAWAALFYAPAAYSGCVG